MRRLKKHPFFVFQFGLLVMVLVVTALTVVACEDGDGGVDPACGSGNLSYDEKTDICRDKTTGNRVPTSCCF